jgi:hypothetical protein
LEKLINRHATGSGTAPNYVNFVANNTGLSKNQYLPAFSNTDSYFNIMWPIFREMAIFEGGAVTRPYYESQAPTFRASMKLV